jgi:alanyl-tRNA synthetase
VIKTSIGQHLHLINLDGNTITNRLKAILKIDAVFRKNVTRNHTTEHILEHVLNKNIDSSIKQEGAYKTDSYFTFDFKLNRRLSEQEIELVQEKVNEIINEEHEVCTAVKKHEEAINNETVGHFTNVYKKIKDGLRVVSIKGVNDEICGGTHVNNTKDIQKFIISEYFAKGTGFWRIVGITSNDSISKYIDSKIEEYQKLINEIKEQIAKYKIKNEEIEQLLQTMNFHSSVKNLIELKKHYLNLNIIFIEYLKLALKSENEENIKNIKETEKLYSSFNNMCYFTVYDKNQKNIISALNELQNELSNPIIICINVTSDKIQYFISCKKDSIFTAKQIIEKINQVSQGAGGGNTFFAQGGSIKKESLNVLLEEIGEF